MLLVLLLMVLVLVLLFMYLSWCCSVCEVGVIFSVGVGVRAACIILCRQPLFISIFSFAMSTFRYLLTFVLHCLNLGPNNRCGENNSSFHK